MKRIVDKYQVPSSFINFEITETAMINFGQSFIENITSLKENGFSFSMDDFGTGYSNFSQMNQVKYKLVKIDKSILWAAFDKDEDSARQAKKVLKSVIKLLKNMGVKIVVEGVETKEMVEYLTQRGVDYLQGYFYSKPLKEEEFIQFIKKQKV